MRTFQATSAPSRSWRGVGSLLLVAVFWCLGDVAQAQDAVATVTHVSGLSTARRADGATRLLAPRSVIHEGEILASEAGTYVEVQFLDDSMLTLGPASRVQVTSYSWNPDNPAADRVVLELLDGTLRSVTGRLGKRNHDAIRIKVPGGEIAVRGTDLVAQAIPPGAPGASGARAPGLYVQVLDGMIHVSNGGGTQNFTAGQFGYTPSFQQPPVILPSNPGLQFTPPPSFSSTTGSAGTSGSKPGAVDCEVR